jgi:ribosomal protein S14
MPKQLFSHPRKFADDSRKCRVTGNCHGLIRKYGINLSRRSFREHAEMIGFVKVSLFLPNLPLFL